MRLFFLYFSLTLIILFEGCTSEKKFEFNEQNVRKIISLEDSYYSYYAKYMRFSDTTIYLSERDSLIQPQHFFEQLRKGNYFPLNSNCGRSFKLVNISKWPEEQVKKLIQGVSIQQLKRINLIGKTLIKEKNLSINSKLFDSSSLMGKVVFAKFWFINCVPCVEEMPQLNEIVLQNKDNDKFVFLSFAFNKPNDLKKFLAKTTFNYEVFPVSTSFVLDTLGIESFPTHLLVLNNKVVKILKDKSEINLLIDQYKLK